VLEEKEFSPLIPFLKEQRYSVKSPLLPFRRAKTEAGVLDAVTAFDSSGVFAISCNC
jgi:hypothetical protein